MNRKYKTFFKINIFLAITALFAYVCLMCVSSAGINGAGLQESSVMNVRQEVASDADFYIQESYKRPVILKFYADWCGPCKRLTPIFEAIATEYGDTCLFQSINIEEHEELTSFFDVKGIPNIIVLQDGQVINRIVGFLSKDKLKSQMFEHITVKTEQEDTTVEKLVIVGSGPAGLTASIYAARAGLQPLVFEGPKPGGQLMDTALIENWPGQLGISGAELIATLKNHAIQSDARFVQSEVTSVDFSSSPLVFVMNDGKKLKAHAAIIATGATPKRLYCQGEDDFWGKGISTCAVCDGALYKNKRVVIVGGGNTAVEDALFLRRFTDKITIVHIHDALKVSQSAKQKIVGDPSITVVYNSTVTKFLSDDSRLSQVEITNMTTKEKTYLDVDGVFLAIGLSPNTELFCDQLDCQESGHIKTYEQVKTSVPGVFVAGDAQDMQYRQAIVSASWGSMAAMEAEKYLQSLV